MRKIDTDDFFGRDPNDLLADLYNECFNELNIDLSELNTRKNGNVLTDRTLFEQKNKFNYVVYNFGIDSYNTVYIEVNNYHNMKDIFVKVYFTNPYKFKINGDYYNLYTVEASFELTNSLEEKCLNELISQELNLEFNNNVDNVRYSMSVTIINDKNDARQKGKYWKEYQIFHNKICYVNEDNNNSPWKTSAHVYNFNENGLPSIIHYYDDNEFLKNSTVSYISTMDEEDITKDIIEWVRQNNIDFDFFGNIINENDLIAFRMKFC